MAEPAPMSMLGTVKDAMLAQAMRLMGSPRVSKLVGDPRLMTAAMKAMSLAGTAKTTIDGASRAAAGALGWASQTEVSELRSTIQTLQDTIGSLETRAAVAEARAAEAAIGQAEPPKAAAKPESAKAGSGAKAAKKA